VTDMWKIAGRDSVRNQIRIRIKVFVLKQHGLDSTLILMADVASLSKTMVILHRKKLLTCLLTSLSTSECA